MRKKRTNRIAFFRQGIFGRVLTVAVIFNMTLGGLFGTVATVKAAGAPVPFYEGFGTGSTLDDIADWDEDSLDQSGYEKTSAHEPTSQNNSESPDGDRFAMIAAKDGWICREIDASGYHSLEMSYYWRGDNDSGESEPNDYGIVEYKTSGTCNGGGGSWHTLKNHILNGNDDNWSYESTFSISELDNNSFLLRLRTDSSAKNENFRVDGINITGIEADTEPPVIEDMEDVIAEAQSEDGTFLSYPIPTATDNVDTDVEVICSPASGSLFDIDTTEVTCEAIDSSGNSAESTFYVTIEDTTPPVFYWDEINPLELVVGDDFDATEGVSAVDNIDGDVLINLSGDTVDTSVPGHYVVVYSAMDFSENEAILNRTIDVSDVSAPVINQIADVTEEATGSDGAVVVYGDVTATDDVDPIPVVTCLLASGSTFPVGTTEVTCEATDSSGNTGYGTGLNVMIVDTTAPVIDVHADVVEEATGPSGAIVDYGTLNAVDAVDGDFSVDCSPVSSSNFSLGDTTVTCNAFDSHFNDALTTIFNVKVQDTTPPTLTLIGDSIVNLVLGSVYNEEGATVEDLVDGAVLINKGGDMVDTSVLGTYHVTFNAMDSAGNHADEVIRTVNVNEEPAPVISDEASPSNTTDSITVAWNTDHPATSRVVYDISSHPVLDVAPNYGYANSTVEDVTLVTSHSVVVSGLEAGTTYYLRSVSHGSPESVGSEVTVTTNDVPVVVPPVGGGDGGGAYIPPAQPTLGVVPVVVGGLNSDLTVELLFDVQNAAQMAISESSDFAGVSWEPYQSSQMFTLSSENTEHKLYIKFRRDTGGESDVFAVTVMVGSTTGPIQAVLGVKVTRLDELIAKLNFGDHSEEVREMQDLLKEIKFFPAYQTSTSLYWHITLSAVQKYLASKVVPQVLGVKVASIEELISITKYGERSENVRALQDELKKIGFFPLVIDSTGYYGPITQGAANAYQESVK